jgi:hypothetical protein
MPGPSEIEIRPLYEMADFAMLSRLIALEVASSNPVPTTTCQRAAPRRTDLSRVASAPCAPSETRPNADMLNNYSGL